MTLGTLKRRTPNYNLRIPVFDSPGWGRQLERNFDTLDGVLFALSGFGNVQGVWENSIGYEETQRVIDNTDGTLWQCTTDHTSPASGTFADDRAANPSYWTLVNIGISFRGAWLLGAEYLIGDFVFDEGENIVAVATANHTSVNLRIDYAAGKWAFIADLKSTLDTAAASAAAAAASAAEAAGAVSGEIGPAIAGSINKAVPVAADKMAITDSEDTAALKHTTFAQMVAAFKTTYDAAYAPITHSHAQSDVTNLTSDLAAKAPINNPTFTGTVTLPGDPSLALQAATKQYVDGLLAGLGNRTTVRAATVGNVTIATALNNADVIDGITLATNDRVLVKNQSAAAENGIYIVGTTPVRDQNFDSWDEHVGAFVSVQEGSVNADTFFLCTANKGGTLGTTAINWSKFVITGELLAANNLSDVANAATALSNLGGLPAAGGTVSGNLTVSGTTTLTGTTTIGTLAGASGKVTLDGALRDETFTITDGAGFAVDPTNGNVQRVTLGANRTPTAANWADGDSVTLFINDGTAYTITWTTMNVVWEGGTAPTLAATGWTEVNLLRENGYIRGKYIGVYAL